MNIKKISIGLACLALFSCSVSAENDQQSAASGKKVYTQKCQNCHGPDGKGNTPIGKSLGGVGDLTISRSKKELFEITSNGRGKMPGFSKSLSMGQIKDVVSYMQTFAGE